MTKDKALDKIAEIRKAFPSPTKMPYDIMPGANTTQCNGQYCVGGALVMSCTALKRPFPTEDEIATAFMTLNPDLDEYAATELALRLVNENDHGFFEAAWDILAFALTTDGTEDAMSALNRIGLDRYHA